RVGAPIDSLSAVRSLAESMGVEEADTAVVRLGAVTVPKLAAMEDSAAVLVLRPPMDVVGGNWTVWLLLAGGITVLAVVGGIGWVAPRTMRQRSPRPGGALSARAAALHELERIRRAGGHRDGRVDEF